MKKTYVKPMIAFESFKMSTSIAGDCGTKLFTYSSYSSCSYDVGGVKIFMGSQCDTEPMGDSDSICYDVPTAATILFGS